MNDIIEKTMKNLRKNNMAAYYVEKKERFFLNFSLFFQ